VVKLVNGALEPCVERLVRRGDLSPVGQIVHEPAPVSPLPPSPSSPGLLGGLARDLDGISGEITDLVADVDLSGGQDPAAHMSEWERVKELLATYRRDLQPRAVQRYEEVRVRGFPDAELDRQYVGHPVHPDQPRTVAVRLAVLAEQIRFHVAHKHVDDE
jgi:hypothetical protein